MKLTLNQVFDHHSNEYHKDLVVQKELLNEQVNNQFSLSFTEEPINKSQRLFREFDTIGDKNNAEK